MQAAAVLDRAQSAVGGGCIYGLGRGGMNPANPVPWARDGRCDCSGFVSWCLGVSRHTDNPWYVSVNGGWFETTAIVRDCGTPFGVFDTVAWPLARVGDLVVWGDHNGHQGHVGVVSAVDATGPVRVIHCSAGNYRATADAIRETNADLFKSNRAIVARCAWVQ